MSAPSEVKINGVFGVTAEVYLEANSSVVPAGEQIDASVLLLDPDDLIIDSHNQSWNGFGTGTNGNLINSDVFKNMLFQIPWSQSSKWDENATWKLVLKVNTQSVEASLANNQVEHLLKVQMPDLEVSINSFTATDPISGQQTQDYVPNTNYTISGTVTNIGNAPTQPNVFMEVRAELVPVSGEANDEGNPVDQQSILFPSNNFESTYIAPDGAWTFEISDIFLPANASGNYRLRVTVNPQNIEGGPVLKEESYTNNTARSSNFLIDTSTSGGDSASNANLAFVENSYSGERGTFRGLQPAYISFSIRNSGNRPVSE